jgi:RND family efflux transporter MFP subunit
MSKKFSLQNLAKAPVFGNIQKLFNTLDSKLLKLKFPLPSIFRNSKIITGLVVLLILIIIVLSFSFPSSVSGIPVYKVKKDNFLVSITVSGEIRAKNSISIVTPRVKGSIKLVYLVPEGTYVNAGDTVVKFDPTEAIGNLKDAEAKLEIALSDKAKLIADQRSQLTTSESQLKEAELSFELSKLNLEQMKFEAQIKQREAKLNHEKNELSLKSAKQVLESKKIIQQSELNKVDIDIQQKRSDLERAKRDLETLTLNSPREGLVVYEINWSTGRKVILGDNAWPGMPILSLPDLSAMQSLTNVNEVDVSRVHKGQKVLVKLDAFQDSTFTGEISSVASLGRTKDRNSTIKVFEIEVDILSQSSILKPGMTTSNKIIVNQIPNVIYIPQESVFEREGKKIVYVKKRSGFDEKSVETGEKNENYIIITKGLNVNDEVALIDPTVKLEDTDNKQDEKKLPSVVK